MTWDTLTNDSEIVSIDAALLPTEPDLLSLLLFAFCFLCLLPMAS